MNRWEPPSAPLMPPHPESNLLLHTRTGMGLATFVGGAFAAGYLVHGNYMQLGQPGKARRALLGFALGGCVTRFVAWHTPPDPISQFLSCKFPELLVVMLAVGRLQGEAIADHGQRGNRFRSNWFAFAVGLAANLALRAVYYGVSLLAP